MMAHYLVSETATINMCIYLCGGYFFMTEHTLDCPEISSTLQQMGSKRMAECMRADGLGNPGLDGKVFDDVKNHYP